MTNMDDSTIRKEIEIILDEVRPNLHAHEGDAHLVGVDDDRNVTLKIEGACRGCPLASMTFGLGVEKMIRDRVPEVGLVLYE